jgi:hypothetical protein
MKLAQCESTSDGLTAEHMATLAALGPQLVLVFGSLDALDRLDTAALQHAVPGAQWVGCSTAGEISASGVTDDRLVATGICWDTPAFRVVSEPLADMADSYGAGQRLASRLQGSDLRHVLVFGQGAHINGSALVNGLTRGLGPQVAVTGGLAGDGGRFTGARVLGPRSVSKTDIVAVGFDGPTWAISHASLGGWQRFGPVRRVTRAEANVLYELDGEPALNIYKRYLGDYADQLPASGLLFPWSVLGEDPSVAGLTRTILGIDTEAGSLILAGDVDEGGHLQLMQASVDALVEAAEAAAKMAADMAADMTAQTPLESAADTPSPSPALALLVSCVGRKLVMGARVDEEVEAVGRALGPYTTLAGFYSNGEISPASPSMDCKLHNQTMTITLIRERATTPRS